ncbi:MAG: DNA replication and repair protein RecF [SAR324 cluster bacterium]|nr:DNA replication and repair protein RecF [SAR324 cluster bacterium]
MVVRGLNLTGFRNYKTLSAKFSPACNWIIGSNGQGKTNLVEAIHYLCNLESFRTRKTSVLLNTESNTARLVGEVERNSVLHKIDVTVNEKGRRVLLDHKVFQRTSEFVLSFASLAFTPEGVSLFRNQPQERRRFFNRILSLVDSAHLADLQSYMEVLGQKNILLKKQQRDAEIKPWNELLARYGVSIIKKRETFVTQVNETLTSVFQELTGREEALELQYEPALRHWDKGEDSVLQEIENSLGRERQYGHALVGPHRDDYRMRLAERRDREFFSQGEYRITYLSLKLCINSVLLKNTGSHPVIILDDLFSELDQGVVNHTISTLEKMDNQVFITAATLPQGGAVQGTQIQVSQGRILEE